MKLSYILSMLLSASLLSMPVAYAGKDKGACMIEKQQELAQNLNLNDNQKKLWHKYVESLKVQKANMEKIRAMREEAKNNVPNTAVEAAEKRLHMREKMIPIQQDQTKAMKTSVVDLKAFYGSLDATQKAQFDAAFKKMQEKRKEKMKKYKECKGD